MSCLKSPFKEPGLNLYALFQKISKGKFEPVSDMYSETLRQMTVKMIQVDSTQRPNIDQVCKVSKAMYKRLSDRSRGKGKRRSAEKEEKQNQHADQKDVDYRSNKGKVALQKSTQKAKIRSLLTAIAFAP